MYLAVAVWQEEGQGMIGYKNAGMGLIFMPYSTENPEKGLRLDWYHHHRLQKKFEVCIILFNFFYDSLLRYDRPERVDFLHFTVKIYFSHHVLLVCGPTLGPARESSHVCVHHWF